MLTALFIFSIQTITPAQMATNMPPDNQDASRRQIDCIFQRMQQPYQLLSLPWLRARQEVRLNRLDGYFSAILLSEMEPFGELSAPLYLENWYWIEHLQSVKLAGQEKALGAVRGSHQQKWFQLMAETVTTEVNTDEELVRLLQLKRVDRILMDLEAFQLNAERLGLNQSDYQLSFFRYVPLGVYFSNQFLQLRPQFLSRFNALIAGCSQQSFALSPQEQQLILQRFLPQAQALSRRQDVQQALLAAKQLLWTEQQILQQDQQWIEEVELGIATLAKQMLLSPLSLQLQQFQQSSAGQIAEIILMDVQGRNVAISEITSDFWQGDEAKYQQVFGTKQSYFLDEVQFDASTARFLTQLSIPVIAADGRQLGVLTLGLDVETSLQYCQLNGDSIGSCDTQ